MKLYFLQMVELTKTVNPIVFGTFDSSKYFENANMPRAFDVAEYKDKWRILALMLFVANIRDRVEFIYYAEKDSYCVASLRSSNIPGAPPSPGDVQLIQSSTLLFLVYGVFFTRYVGTDCQLWIAFFTGFLS